MKHLYIVRNPFNVFNAGDLVQEAAPAVGKTVRVHLVNRALPTVEMELGNLLQKSRFLLNKPKYNFWVLRRYYKPAEYVSDAAAKTFGVDPFHFESLGEVVFYLKSIEHKADDYLIGQYRHMPTLTPK